MVNNNKNKRRTSDDERGGGDERVDHVVSPVPAEEEQEEEETVDPMTKDVISLTNEELQALSFEDQEKIIHDLYGFSDAIDEESEGEGFVEERLLALREELDKSATTKCAKAYQLALQIDSSYVTSRSFLLQFLRADRFHVSQAATRLLAFLEIKLEFFGPQLLCLDITQDHLDPTSREVLYKTWYVDLPVRDRAGRQVVILLSRADIDCSSMPVECRIKVLFYTMGVAARSAETQIHGRVYIIWVAGYLGKASDLWRISKVQAASPIRLQGIHMCIDEEAGHLSTPLVSLAQMAAASFLRSRIRRHTGTPSELKFALMTYGIPTDFIPINDQGEFAHKLHTERWNRIWNNERLLAAKQQQQQQQQQQQHAQVVVVNDNKNKELPPPPPPKDNDTGDANPTSPQQQSSDNTAAITSTKKKAVHNVPGDVVKVVVVDTPSNSDVLMGKGKGVQDHIGNIRFRALIESFRTRYDAATKTQKTDIAKEILQLVTLGWKGRFLKEDRKLGWIPLNPTNNSEDNVACRRKVASCFRDARKFKKPSSSNTTTKNKQKNSCIDNSKKQQQQQSTEPTASKRNKLSLEQQGTSNSSEEQQLKGADTTIEVALLAPPATAEQEEKEREEEEEEPIVLVEEVNKVVFYSNNNNNHDHDRPTTTTTTTTTAAIDNIKDDNNDFDDDGLSSVVSDEDLMEAITDDLDPIIDLFMQHG